MSSFPKPRKLRSKQHLLISQTRQSTAIRVRTMPSLGMVGRITTLRLQRSPTREHMPFSIANCDDGEQCSAAGLSANRFMQTRWEHVGYTVKITMTSKGPVIVGLELQGVAILLGCVSAYSIWRTLKEMSLASQASISELLASQSIEILKYIAEDLQLYEFLQEQAAVVESPTPPN